ncbi:MAG: TPM domain-containing protein, partial [Mesorhizobium sp.]
MATRPISAEDHDRIAEAIRAAESKTDGEIYCVVAYA